MGGTCYLGLPINCDFFAYFCSDLGKKNMLKEAICAKMTKYKVVQNAGMSLTKGACVTLSEFIYISVYILI